MITIVGAVLLLYVSSARATVSYRSLVLPVDGDSLKLLHKSDPLVAPATACHEAILTYCQLDFNHALNITDTNDWTSPDTLAQDLLGYYLQGVSGVLKICDAHTRFFQCLGSSYSQCINRFYFLQNGFDQASAYGYVEIFKTLEFGCTGGFIQSVNHWDCILRTAAGLQNYSADCRNAFNQSITANPSSFCSAAMIFAGCLSYPFYSDCGSETGWWECERIRLAFDVDDICPTNQCKVGIKRFDSAEQNAAIAKNDAMRRVPSNGDEYFNLRPDLTSLYGQIADRAAAKVKLQQSA